MAADVLDQNPQLNRLLLMVRDAVKPHLSRRHFGDIMLSGPIVDGVIGKVRCTVVPIEDLTPLANRS